MEPYCLRVTAHVAGTSESAGTVSCCDVSLPRDPAEDWAEPTGRHVPAPAWRGRSRVTNGGGEEKRSAAGEQ